MQDDVLFAILGIIGFLLVSGTFIHYIIKAMTYRNDDQE